MTIIALLITISLTIALIFLGVFLWSMKSGQYDDTYTPSVRMLFENKPEKVAEETKSLSKVSEANEPAFREKIPPSKPSRVENI